jgi:ATP:corrinoid adenosyltransferase
MELNVFVEDYIKENHSQYSDKAQEEMRKAIRAGYYFAKGSDEPVDENSIEFIQRIYDKAKKIYEAKDLEAEEKYDMIFSDEISRKVNFDYYDPDTSYEEDVAAFMRGFEEYIETVQRKSKY